MAMSMKTAFLFSGQGSQKVGMGSELIASCDDCRKTFDIADQALGFSLTELMIKGPEDELSRTEITQPAVLTLSVAHARHLQARGLTPDVLAGHSIGQYSALVLANSLEFEDAVPLVAARGRLMQQCVPEGEGAMMAIVGLERDQVYRSCDAARSLGVVNVALHNAPGQTVISGSTSAVETAAQHCEDEGGGVVPLPVSAPFHCDLLSPMLPAFTELVEAIPFRDPATLVIDNVTARPLTDSTMIRRSLINQITSPVLFEESLRYMIDSNSTRFIECGPGKSLLGFAKRISRDLELVTFEQALDQVISSR